MPRSLVPFRKLIVTQLLKKFLAFHKNLKFQLILNSLWLQQEQRSPGEWRRLRTRNVANLQFCTFDLGPRGKGSGDVSWPWSIEFGDSSYRSTVNVPVLLIHYSSTEVKTNCCQRFKCCLRHAMKLQTSNIQSLVRFTEHRSKLLERGSITVYHTADTRCCVWKNSLLVAGPDYSSYASKSTINWTSLSKLVILKVTCAYCHHLQGNKWLWSQ